MASMLHILNPSNTSLWKWEGEGGEGLQDLQDLQVVGAQVGRNGYVGDPSYVRLSDAAAAAPGSRGEGGTICSEHQVQGPHVLESSRQGEHTTELSILLR